VPVPVVAIGDAVQVGAGLGYTCALSASGEVRCWGDNAYGQLGDGTGAPSLTPVLVSGLTDAVQLACGFYHACAVRRSGQVACWGSDFHGMLGDGRPFTIGFAPVTVSGLTDALQVACGYWHTCAVRRSGAVTCWGDNGGGQIGDGTATDSYTPAEVLLP
jgi:alpha-tubulin suppressor-like RCC1 family protein